MQDLEPHAVRNCSWCKKEIGKSARVCPHCYRGQGLWIAVTAVPTWLSAVVAVAATGYVLFHAYTLDMEARGDSGRLDALQAELAQTRASLDRVERDVQASRELLARRPAPVQPAAADLGDAAAVAPFDSSALEASVGAVRTQLANAQRKLERLQTTVEAAGRDASRALQESTAARKAVAAVEEDVQKGRDSLAMNEIEARVQGVNQQFRATVVACRKGTEADCQSAKADTVTLFASLSNDVEGYRGYVSDISHGIMVRDACNQGRRMAEWTPSGQGFARQTWGEFSGWYRENCP